MKSQNVGIRFITWLATGTLMVGGCSKQPAHETLTSSTSIVIEPGVSIGPVRQGMTMRQVVAELGEPDQNNDGVLWYKRLGLVVNPATANREVVGSVLCLDSESAGASAKAFAGRTKQGIGVGSSHADVISAYGKPDVILRVGKSENLSYKVPGLHFNISDGKVCLIAVFFQPMP